MISVRIGAACAACDLTAAQADVVLLLLDLRGLTCAQLSRALHHDGGAMSRLVAALETRGLVRRERIASLRRAYVFELTGPGREVAERCRNSLADCWNGLLGGWNEHEFGELTRTLERLVQTIGAGQTSRREMFGGVDAVISPVSGTRRPCRSQRTDPEVVPGGQAEDRARLVRPR